MWRLAIVAMVVAGCTGQEVQPAQLASNWETDPIGGCSTTLVITAATFELGTRCGDSLQAVAGAYTIDGDVLTMTADKATCGAAPRVYTDSMSLEGDSLVLTNEGGSQAFQRMPAAPAGAYGCFINGTFEPSPLAPL
jgi:hypothetical protein